MEGLYVLLRAHCLVSKRNAKLVVLVVNKQVRKLANVCQAELELTSHLPLSVQNLNGGFRVQKVVVRHQVDYERASLAAGIVEGYFY